MYLYLYWINLLLDVYCHRLRIVFNVQTIFIGPLNNFSPIHSRYEGTDRQTDRHTLLYSIDISFAWKYTDDVIVYSN